jgi:transcription elongation factor Elf1
MKLFQRKPKTRKQTTFVYCPTCRLEQISNSCFVSDTDVVRYRCSHCGTETAWDFDAPVPLLLKTTRPRPQGRAMQEETKG